MRTGEADSPAWQVFNRSDWFETDEHWRATRHLFSFGQHYDPNRVRCGPVAAVNWESLQPGSFYPSHRHRSVDIVTWVVSGSLRHRDPVSGDSVIPAGCVQALCAGSGIEHEEGDSTGGAGVQFIQMWLESGDAQARPTYDWAPASDGSNESGWILLAGSTEADCDSSNGRVQPAVGLTRSDARLWLRSAAVGERVPLPPHNSALIVVVAGSAVLGRRELASGSAASGFGGSGLIEMSRGSTILFWALESPPSRGGHNRSISAADF